MATVTGGTIKWNLDIDKSGFDSKLDQTSSKSKKFAGVLKKVFKGVGIAVAAGLAVAIKRSASFETALTNISTLLSGDSTKAIEGFKKGILDMMSRVPASADELGASAYAIVSAGITDTSEALKILETSARLGTAGLGTTEEATTLMVLALNNFKESGLTSDQAANILFKTVKGGITTIADLSQSFGLVAPLAVDAGVTMEELSAATAALTQVNKSASISQNSIKAALVSLAKPTKEAQTLFEGLGVKTFPELIKKSGGMVAAFQAMKDETKGNTQQFAKAIGSGEALTSVISLLGDQSGAFNESWASMRDGTDSLTEAFEKQKATFSNSLKILRNNLDKIAISVGSKLLPHLTNFAQVLGENIGPAMDKVVAFIKKLVDSMGGWKSITKKVTSILKSLGKIFSKTILPAINDLWEALKKDLLPSLQELWKQVGPVLIPVLKVLAVILGVAILGAIMATIQGIKMAVTVFSIIAKVISFAFGVVSSVIGGAINIVKGFVDFIINLPTTIGNAITAVMDWFKKLPENIGFIIGRSIKLLFDFANRINIFFTEDIPKFIDVAIKFFKELPGKIGDALLNMWNTIVKWFDKSKETSKTKAKEAVTGFIDFFKTLPEKLATVFTDVLAEIISWGPKLLQKGKDIAGDFWEGFQKGLGMSSPSFIERAFIDIAKQSDKTLSQLKSDMGKFNTFGASIAPIGITSGPIGTSQAAIVNSEEEITLPNKGIVINQTNTINKETDMEAALRELGWELSI